MEEIKPLNRKEENKKEATVKDILRLKHQSLDLEK